MGDPILLCDICGDQCPKQPGGGYLANNPQDWFLELCCSLGCLRESQRQADERRKKRAK